MGPLTDNARDTVRGIALVACSYVIISVGDIASKWTILASGVAWVMLWRGIIGAGAILAMTCVSRHGTGRLRPVRVSLLALRSALASANTLTWYVAWQQMPLADTYALGFTAPLIMTVLAAPILGERIPARRILATFLGFAGVLIMLRPGGIALTPTVWLLLAGIVAMALSRILTRQLSQTETPECQAFWLMVTHSVAGLVMLLGWSVPSYGGGWIWPPLLFLGVTSGFAQLVFTHAYGLAPVSALAPYEYTPLIWGGLGGYAVFGEVPAWSTLAGAVIVVAAGLFNLQRETARRDRAKAASAHKAASANKCVSTPTKLPFKTKA